MWHRRGSTTARLMCIRPSVYCPVPAGLTPTVPEMPLLALRLLLEAGEFLWGTEDLRVGWELAAGA